MIRFFAFAFLALVLSTTGGTAKPTLTTLYHFCNNGRTPNNCADGSLPTGLLIEETAVPGAPIIFGTTKTGGTGQQPAGVVFELTPNDAGTTYGESVLYNFCSSANCTDGAQPFAGLIIDDAGNLFGTTYYGGSSNNGTLWALERTAGGYSQSVLYNFCSLANCADGQNPLSLIFGTSGFYGTTTGGGSGGGGAVFGYSVGGTESTLYSFCSQPNCADGKQPAGITLNAGNLFGTTGLGGVNNNGVLFELTPGGTETVLYRFCSNCGTEHGGPGSPWPLAPNGSLYGAGRGSDAKGVYQLFRVGPKGSIKQFAICWRQNCNRGAAGRLVTDGGGKFYSTRGLRSPIIGEAYEPGAAVKLVPRVVNGVRTYIEKALWNFGGSETDPISPSVLAIDTAGNLYGTVWDNFGGAVFKLTP